MIKNNTISITTTTTSSSSGTAETPEAWPLTGVDMIECPCAGVLVWQVRAGDTVQAGALLGEVVSVDDVDAPRTPIFARTSGVVFAMWRHKLAIPGVVAIKVAGSAPLPWRKGNLLTA